MVRIIHPLQVAPRIQGRRTEQVRRRRDSLKPAHALHPPVMPASIWAIKFPGPDAIDIIAQFQEPDFWIVNLDDDDREG